MNLHPFIWIVLILGTMVGAEIARSIVDARRVRAIGLGGTQGIAIIGMVVLIAVLVLSLIDLFIVS